MGVCFFLGFRLMFTAISVRFFTFFFLVRVYWYRWFELYCVCLLSNRMLPDVLLYLYFKNIRLEHRRSVCRRNWNVPNAAAFGTDRLSQASESTPNAYGIVISYMLHTCKRTLRVWCIADRKLYGYMPADVWRLCASVRTLAPNTMAVSHCLRIVPRRAAVH